MSASVLENYSKVEELKKVLEIIDEKTKLRPIKNIISEYIFENKNEYLKIETLDLVYYYTLNNQLPPSFLKEIMLGILEEFDTTTEYYFLERVIKICFLEDLFSKEDEKRIQEINDKEVLSTYYYYKGISSLRKIIYKIEEGEKYIEKLKEIKKDIIYSYKLYERLDSKYYTKIIDLLIEILINKNIEENLLKLKNIYSELMLLSMDENREEEIDMIYLIDSLQNISKILDNEKYWIDYRKEYNKIFYYIQKTIGYEYKKGMKNIFFDFKEELVKKYIAKRIFFEIKSYRKKLELLIDESKNTNPLFSEIFNSILLEIELKENKVEIDEWFNIISKSTLLLLQNETLISKDLILNVIKDKGKDNLEKFDEMLDIFLELFNSKQLLLTGYPNGDKILEKIIKEVKELLENRLEIKKILCFQNIISNIINYVYTISTASKEMFPIYYNSCTDNLVESLFQKDLYIYLKKSSYAYNYIYEHNNTADNGRCDIFYKSDNVSIPIEIKKTKSKKLTKEIIEKKYIYQASTYTYPYDKIGIFILIDISEKTKQYSPNELENTVYVHQLESHLKLENNLPNVVVSIIIPANRVAPSEKSIYS